MRRPCESPTVVNISYSREQLLPGLHQQISAGSVKFGVEAGYTFKTVDFGNFVLRFLNANVFQTLTGFRLYFSVLELRHVCISLVFAKIKHCKPLS